MSPADRSARRRATRVLRLRMVGMAILALILGAIYGPLPADMPEAARLAEDLLPR